MTKSKKLIARKGREYYSRTIRFTKEQDEWLSEQEDVQGIFREHVDNLINEESLEEAAKLRERAELLDYKVSSIVDQIQNNQEAIQRMEGEAGKEEFIKKRQEENEELHKQRDATYDEIKGLKKKVKEIEEKAKVAAERRRLAALTPEEKQKLEEEKKKRREEHLKEVYGDKKEKTQEEKEAEERLRKVLSDSETDDSKTDNSENKNPWT